MSDEDRLSNPLDPEDALRGLLKVDPDAPPAKPNDDQPAPEKPLKDQGDALVEDGTKALALRRLRFAKDEELAVFEGSLREDALRAGASEDEIREAQRTHPEHG